MEFLKERENLGIDREPWSEESQLINFRSYTIKLTLRHQGEDVRETEKYVGLDGECLSAWFVTFWWY